MACRKNAGSDARRCEGRSGLAPSARAVGEDREREGDDEEEGRGRGEAVGDEVKCGGTGECGVGVGRKRCGRGDGTGRRFKVARLRG